MFDTSAGWLRYKPFSSYTLPTIEIVESPDGKPVKGDFVRRGKVNFSRPLYRLRWPGQIRRVGHDEERPEFKLPARIVEQWPTFVEGTVQKAGYPIETVLEKDWLPEEIPEVLAYHLAVNHDHYWDDLPVQYPVAGLPADAAQEVVGAFFAIDEQYHAALKYLKWLAEGHRPHPLLTGFDTNIRERLLGIAEEAAYLYFYMLQDCLYDVEAKWYNRSPARHLWSYLATYLHWVGRSGTGTYMTLSKLNTPDVHASLWDIQGDVAARMRLWHDGLDGSEPEGVPLMWKARGAAHVQGEPLGVVMDDDVHKMGRAASRRQGL